MPVYHEQVTVEGVKTEVGGEVVLPPRDLGTMPLRTITVECAAGEGHAGLAAASIELAPTQDGPWIAEDLSQSGIPTLDAGKAAAYRVESADRWVRVLAQGAVAEGKTTDVTVYIDAVG